MPCISNTLRTALTMPLFPTVLLLRGQDNTPRWKRIEQDTLLHDLQDHCIHQPLHYLSDGYWAVFSSVIPLTALPQSRYQKRPPHRCESLDSVRYTCYIMCKWCTVKLFADVLVLHPWVGNKVDCNPFVDRACFIVWIQDTMFCLICLVRCINCNSHTNALEWILTAFESSTHIDIPSFQHSAL